MTDVAAALMAEIASLENELEKDARYVRCRELRRIYDLYVTATGSDTPATAADQDRSSNQRIQLRHSARPFSDRERALAAARDYVMRSDRVVPTREVLEHLSATGINIGGVSPLNNLSAMISTSGSFQSHGRKGWTLKNGSAPVLTEDDYEQIVGKIIGELTPSESAQALAELEARKGIPPAIDRRLLAYSRERINGQLLTDEQMKALRETFAGSIKIGAA